MVAQSQIPGRDFAIVHGTVTAKPRCVPIQNSFRQSATYRAVEEIQKKMVGMENLATERRFCLVEDIRMGGDCSLPQGREYNSVHYSSRNLVIIVSKE